MHIQRGTILLFVSLNVVHEMIVRYPPFNFIRSFMKRILLLLNGVKIDHKNEKLRIVPAGVFMNLILTRSTNKRATLLISLSLSIYEHFD